MLHTSCAAAQRAAAGPLSLSLLSSAIERVNVAVAMGECLTSKNLLLYRTTRIAEYFPIKMFSSLQYVYPS